MTKPTTKHMNIQISFGALSEPISDQLQSQGLCLDLSPLNRACFQRDADAVTRLHIRSILTEAEARKARKRIIAIIKKHARPIQQNHRND